MPESSFLNPARIIESLPLEEGMRVCEFGSGTGMFSTELAKKLGRDGKVFAVDVQKETLEALRAKARMEGIFNLETVWSDLEKPGSTHLAEASLDFAFLPNVLFQSQKKADILQEAYRVTKTGGSVVIIDWIPDKAIFGKNMGWLLSKEEMKKLAEAAGFSFTQDVQTGSAYHYGLLFRK